MHFDRPVRIFAPLIEAPNAIPDTAPFSMYDCHNPLCDAHAPCEDPGFDNAEFSECGCALRTTAYLPDKSLGPTCPGFGVHEIVQCSSGLLASDCDSVCNGGSCDASAPAASLCPSVPPYANFYYDYPAPYLASWQDVPFNPDAGASTQGAVRCSATGRYYPQ